METDLPDFNLRSFQIEDAGPVHLLLNDREVSKYLTSQVSYPYSLEQARNWVQQGSQKNPTWAIDLNGELAGCIGIEPYEGSKKVAQLGYWIGRRYWGQGLATAAVQRVTRDTLAQGQYHRMMAGVFHTNLASMRVLEKCGYQLEAVMCQACFKQGKYYDKHLYAFEG